MGLILVEVKGEFYLLFKSLNISQIKIIIAQVL